MSFFSKIRSLPEFDILSGIIFFIGAIHYFSKDSLNAALCLFLFSLSLLAMGLLRLKSKDSIPDVFLFLYLSLVLFRLFQLDKYLANKMNTKMPRQETCGKVINIKDDKWFTRHSKQSFEIDNGKSIVKFNLRNMEKYLSNSNKTMCVEYAHDPKWSIYPFIFQIRTIQKHF